MKNVIEELERKIKVLENQIEHLEHGIIYYQQQIAYKQKNLYEYLAAKEKLETSSTKPEGEDTI